MVDLLDRNTQAPNRDAEIDDPLAELARIIGYERPADRRPTGEDGSQSNEFDLEAELMRELDVPQGPAVDDFDLLEADEADDGAEMVAGPAPEPGPIEPAHAPGADQPWVEPGLDDLRAWEPVDDLAEQDLAPAFEDITEPEAFDAGGPVSDLDLDDLWAAADLDIEPEPEFYDAPAAPGPARDEPGQVIKADFGGRHAAAPAGMGDDDVLADMFRFELPARSATGPQPAAAPAAATRVPDASGVFPQDTAPYRDRDVHDEFEGADGLPHADLDDDTVEPDFAADAFEAYDEPTAPALVADTPIAPPLDFEDFLSTELEAFEQNLSTDSARRGRTDDVVEASQGAGLETDPGHGAWDDAAAEAGDSVFDEAAEELLADIADDEPTYDRKEFSADASEAWPAEAIEEAIVEELDEELEGPVAVPDPLYDPFATQSDPDDLDFDLDLDQVLADTAVELGSEWAEPELSAPRDLPRDEGVEAWQAVPVAVARDEMAEAFLGLVPPDNGQTRDAAPAPARRIDAEQPVRAAGAHRENDWLDGFETTEATEQSGADGYYFDAQLISEPEVTVEAVADIDVPELVHDDPQVVEPDYDTDIEREFASIVDVSDAESGAPIGTDHAATEEWGRPDPAARYEVSDDYVALERELGVTPSGYSYRDPDMIADGLAYAAPEREVVREEPAQRGPGSRGSVLALAVLGFAVLAGAGALGWSMLSGDDAVVDGGPRIIRADTEPVKVLPENPGGVTVPNQDKAVYDRVAGSDATSPGQPSLVNTAEEPVDVVQRTLDPEILPLEGRDDPSVKSEDRLAAGGSGADGAGEAASAPVVSPRRVRTMIVKPDGSIVAREEPDPAPEPQAALAEPSGADAMTAEPATEEAAAAAELVPAAAPLEQAAAEPAAAPAALAPGAPAEVPATDQSIAPVRVVTTQPVRAPVPQNRPADQPVTVVGTVTQGGNVANPQTLPAAPAQPEEVASAPVAAAPAAAPATAAPATAAPAANPGGFYVQIASQPSAEGAQASWQALSSRYSSVLGGRGVDIQRADIPGKGVFHRVRIPAGSRDEANALCARYKSAGGSCFVSR